MALLGLSGNPAQQASIDAIKGSAQYTSGIQAGEEAILQNASATGGLRGGNTQNSLARFRSDLLTNTIQSQLQNIGGLTSLGQNAAAGVGNNALNSASNVGNLLNQQGAALAGGQIAKGNAVANNFNTMLQAAGVVAGF